MIDSHQSKLLFVINPISGGKEKTDWESGIKEYFHGSSLDIYFHGLKGENDAILLKDQISKYQPDKVIAVGGDGTLKLVAEQLLNTNMALGILPAGSANGMAKELGIPDEINDALNVIHKGTIRKIDVVKINDNEISLHLSDIGLNALLIKYYQKGKKRGMWGYAKAIFRVLSERRYMRVEMQIPGQKLVRKAFMVVVANTRTYGTGAIINPEGNLYDGKFELVVVKKLSVPELFKMILTHQSFNPEKIETIQTEQVAITIPHRSYFQVDGEYRGKVRGLEAKILPASLNMLLPIQSDSYKS
ncbi:MAG: diacylglycerol kinase family lipid kinase [Chitinophagales bacterium]|nr:diacylglycerol kinase family lipid kinase [Chitinophagales bacterium]